MDPGERRDRLRRILPRAFELSARRPRVSMSSWLQRGRRRGRWARFREVMTTLDAALLREIEARRSRHADRGDFLSALLNASHEDGTPMTDVEVRDQLVTLFVAGHEPMERALPSALELLLRHPAALTRLARELESGGSHYLDAVVKEALRLEPGRTMVGRRLRGPMELNGYRLPAGTTVTPNIYLTHRRPDIYEDPRTFRPERFLTRPPDTYTWIPFGGGTRRCLAAGFAMLELKVVISSLLRRARLGPGPRIVLHQARPRKEFADAASKCSA
jgi:cytochrome P450